MDPTACRFCNVCEATWPKLSPVTTPFAPPRNATRSAMRNIKRRYSRVRKASGTSAAPRVNQQWSARHFDAASELRGFEIDTDTAPFGSKPVEKIPADLALDGQRIQWKAFVASPGAHGKAGEGLAADFFPGGCAEGVERASVEIGAAQDARDTQMGDSADARQPPQGLFDLRGVRKLDDQSIGGLGDSGNGNSLQRAPQRLA